MRIETIPLLIGILVALLGVALIADAWLPDDIIVPAERRRRARAERHRGGEAAIGLGVLCVSAAFFGRDQWGYSVLAVAAGLFLFLLGAWLNRPYLRELLEFRGPARRDPSSELKPGMPGYTPPPKRDRWRLR